MRLHLLLLLLCPPLGLLATGSRVAGALLLACMVAGTVFGFILHPSLFFFAAAAAIAAWLHGVISARSRLLSLHVRYRT